MGGDRVNVSDAISRNINWARVIREVFSKEDLKIMDVEVVMTKPPQIGLVFYSDADMNRFERVRKETASGTGAYESGTEHKNEDGEPVHNPATEFFTLLDSANIKKSVYTPPALTAG